MGGPVRLQGEDTLKSVFKVADGNGKYNKHSREPPRNKGWAPALESSPSTPLSGHDRQFSVCQPCPHSPCIWPRPSFPLGTTLPISVHGLQ